MKLLSCSFAVIASIYFLNPFAVVNLSAATVAYWDFEDGTAGAAFSSMPSGGSVDTVNGYVMYGYDGTYGPSFSADTPIGTGLGSRHNGSQDGYTTDTVINAWSPVTWTIEMAAKLEDISGWETLIGRDGSTSGTAEADFYLQKNNSNGAFRINFYTTGGDRYILDSNFAPLSNQWYRLAVTSDGTTVTMYCDKLDGNGYQNVGSLTMSAVPAENALVAGGFNWTFGRGWYNNNFVDHVTGYFDDIRFSDVVLTPNQFLGYCPVGITESAGKTVLYAGDMNYTDEYEVVLTETPSEEVLITVTPPAGLTVGNGSGQSRVLTFTSVDWDQPQTVTIAIADLQAALGEVEIIQHAVQSEDPNFSDVTVPGVQVYIEEDSCGVWGYVEGDYNLDCFVNLEDFAILGRVWLAAEAPLDLQTLAGDWLVSTILYDEEIYARSIQESDQPFFVNTANVVNTVDDKVYGHFLEHIYHSVNGGLWGELVWNRSFEMDGSGGGLWTIEGDELVQSSLSTDVHMEFGDPSWTDYEITLEAKKDSGAEAFLILFRASDSDNFYWCNIGGWGNIQHAIEKEVNGSRSVVTSYVSGSINTDQWYDIRIRCVGNHFQVWLDETQIIDYTDSSSPHSAGMIGLGTWSTQARYRNIQVTEYPDTQEILFTGLPALAGNEFGASFWTVFGSGQATMDTNALNDDLSVQIAAAAGGTGLQQDDFKFIPQVYYGSLWMKGSLPAGLLVELLDGTTVLGQAALSAPASAWTEYTFQITPTAATDQGTLRITLQGAGTVNIDQVSLMGQDAVDTGGYRPDLLAAVEDLNPPIIRWPGGCYASAYFWKDGIGPQYNRVKYPINLWDDQDTNSYGTDEYLRMCEAIGAEPLLVINTGLLDSTCGVSIPYKLTEAEYLQDVLDWMEYCNGDAVATTWGAARAANGHPEPYNVTYWEIDNETWSAGASAYVARVQEFAPAMRDKADLLGTPIQLIACGGSGLDMSWNQTVINGCAALVDYISVHNYDDAGEYKSGPSDYDGFLATLAAYIASSDNPDLKIYNSEWNLQTTDWRTGLYAGGILNVFERHGENFEIGGPALFLRHTSASAWDNAFINFDHTGWFPAPNYVVMKLWHDHRGPNRVETTGTDTNLNVTTLMSEDEQTLYIRVVNPNADSKSVAFDIDNSFVPETAYMHYVAPGDLYARNTLADPDAVQVEAKVIGIDGQILRLLMPAYSAGVITVQTSQPHATEFLYSSFRSNGEDGLHLAYSEDGLTWAALNDDASFLTPQVGSNLMRDPSICQGPDGMFHLVWTTGWWDDGIGIAHSADLINWSAQTYLPVMAHEPDALNCWAPEIFYDRVTSTFLIFWSTTIPGRFPETDNPDDDNNHRIYYVTTQDFVTYTDTALFYDPGFNVIDAFVAKDNDRYVLFMKHESKDPVVEKNIRMAFGDEAAGPYGPASASISPAWVEGPSAVRIGIQWHLYYDAYTRGRMEGQTSPDMTAWTDMTSQLSFPSGTRHGTVFRVTQEVLDALLAL